MSLAANKGEIISLIISSGKTTNSSPCAVTH